MTMKAFVWYVTYRDSQKPWRVFMSRKEAYMGRICKKEQKVFRGVIRKAKKGEG